MRFDRLLAHHAPPSAGVGDPHADVLAIWERESLVDAEIEANDDLRVPGDEEGELHARGDGRFARGTGQFEVRAPEVPEPQGEAPVSRIMARKVVCVRPEIDASEARRRMLERRVSGLPVVDTWGRAIGLISKTDLIEHEVTSDAGRATVADIMMPLVFALPPDAPIAQAAALMAYEGIHRVVVVDRSGYLVGLVSALDVARWMARAGGYLLDTSESDGAGK